MTPGDDLGILRRLVAQVRLRGRIAHGLAGAVILACGAGAAALAWTAEVTAAGAVLLAPALAASAALAAAGAAMLAGAAFRPPTEKRIADWIEIALPQLRDSLATALEGGPLAPVAAAYAARRIDPAAVRAVEPARRRRARPALLAAAGVVLVWTCLARFQAAAGRNAPGGAGAPGPDRPAAGGDAGAEPSRPVAYPPPDEPSAALDVKIVVRPADVERPTAAPRHSNQGAAAASEVLLGAPEGFERAVELFMVGDGPVTSAPGE